MSGTTIVIPTFNESENLPRITAELLSLPVENLSVLVVDDASPDGTGQVAEKLASQNPGRFHVLHRSGKLGLGTAYVTGFTWAMARGADYIVQMDADFSHSPRYVPQFLEYIKDYDVVVGSRYVWGSELDREWGWGRRLLSSWANTVWVRLFLGLRTRDTTAGFKCWRRGALERIDLARIRSTGYVFQVEMCYLSEKLGLLIKELPIVFEDRRLGQSKMSSRVKLEAALRVIALRWQYGTLRQVKTAHLSGLDDQELLRPAK